MMVANETTDLSLWLSLLTRHDFSDVAVIAAIVNCAYFVARKGQYGVMPSILTGKWK